MQLILCRDARISGAPAVPFPPPRGGNIGRNPGDREVIVAGQASLRQIASYSMWTRFHGVLV